LLGLDGVAIVAHGGSTALAIKNAIRVASESVAQDVNGHISAALESMAQAETENKVLQTTIRP
jgi:glycerol-3-phosphate acyltransferase PlsX